MSGRAPFSVRFHSFYPHRHRAYLVKLKIITPSNFQRVINQQVLIPVLIGKISLLSFHVSLIRPGNYHWINLVRHFSGL